MTIQKEKPELEVKNLELLQKEEEMKMQLDQLEQTLLEVFYFFLNLFFTFTKRQNEL